jgi:type 1 fimbria pilin
MTFINICLGIILTGYASFCSAACSPIDAYISPLNYEFQGAANAANKGGMLSSEWHESILRVYCTNFGVVFHPSIQYALDIKMRALSGWTTSFEGRTYGLWSTGTPDVYMIMQYGRRGYAMQAANSTDLRIMMGPPNGNNIADQEVLLRVRFFSRNPDMLPGIRTIAQQPLLASNPIYKIINVTSCGTNLICSGAVGMMYTRAASFTVNSISCRLVAPSQVNLRSASIAQLPAPGTTIEVASFQLGASCDKADFGYKISYSVVDVNDPSNQSSNLSIATETNSSSGIALQILDNGTPITMGIKSGPPSSRLFLADMPASGGVSSKTMIVRYVRTGATATPGHVSAGISVTFSYD